ncbi:MAG TPA: carboxypeptidase regulatory-like domain-containing protein, partial [Rhodothermales bacterium]|nr:carboxypeptidase regulatory-like domain-containing protein [Rhodothermales bacterium]
MLFALSAWAQDTGRITGSVRIDRSDAPVAGVNVVVVGTLYGAVTDEGGQFVVDAVPSGSYVVAINALGYRPAQRSVNVEAGSEVMVDFRLQPPEAQLDEATAEGGRRDLWPRAIVETRRIREVNAQDTGGLLRLLPGSGAMRGNGSGLQPHVRGLWEPQMGIVVDGAPFAPGSPYGIGSPLDVVDPTSIESIEVVQGPYALTWGAGMLSAIRVISRGSDPSPGPLASVQGAYTSNLGVLEGIGAVSGVAAGVGFRLFGALRTGNDYADGSGEEFAADYRSINMGGRLGYDVSPAARLSVTGGYQDQREVETPGRILDLDDSQAVHLAARFQQAYATGVVRGLDARVSWNHLHQRVTYEDRALPDQRSYAVGTAHNQLGGRLAAQMLAVGRWPLEVGSDVDYTRQEALREGSGDNVILPEKGIV